MNTSVLRFKQELYPKEAVMKAAYRFLDRSYIHVDVQQNEYIIEIVDKGHDNSSVTPYEFENELLAQAVRYQVYNETHTIREILMARAMSSTITGTHTALNDSQLNGYENDLDDILTDWFDKNE